MLNKRQKQLYEYLLEHEGETICKFQVVNHFEGAYAVEEKEKNSKSHKILDDVKALNRDETIEKIIIYKNNTLKIATEEEAKEYRNLFLKKL